MDDFAQTLAADRSDALFPACRERAIANTAAPDLNTRTLNVINWVRGKLYQHVCYPLRVAPHDTVTKLRIDNAYQRRIDTWRRRVGQHNASNNLIERLGHIACKVKLNIVLGADAQCL